MSRPGPIICGQWTDYCLQGLGNTVSSPLSYLFLGHMDAAAFLTGQASGPSPMWPGWVLVAFLRGEKGLSGAYSECTKPPGLWLPGQDLETGDQEHPGEGTPVLPGLSSVVAWSCVTPLPHPQCPVAPRH